MNRPSQGRVVLLGTLLALCSAGPFYVAPDYLAALQRVHGFTLAQLGYVSGVESLMIGLACAATGFALPRLGWRAMCAAALACVVGNLATVYATTFPAVLGVRALTGLLGEGPLYAMSYAVLGSAANPDRAFGIGVGSVAVSAAAVIALEPALGGLFGPAAVLFPYALMALTLTAMTVLTRPGSTAEAAAGPAAPGILMRACAMLLSMILWSAAAGAFWAFTGTAAQALSVSGATMSRALTVALMVGLGGMAVPVLLANRFGRAGPLLLSTLGLVGSCFLFFVSHALFALALALSIMQLCWNVASVYQLAGISTVDRSGRYSAFGGVAQIAGLALGPALAGGPLNQFGFGFMPFAVAGIAGVAFALFVAGAWRLGAGDATPELSPVGE
jgi:predicted MFS family arabinose efflux permease